MSVKDMLLALCVVVAWGVNFVVIAGFAGHAALLLAGLRFTLVAFPAIFSCVVRQFRCAGWWCMA